MEYPRIDQLVESRDLLRRATGNKYVSTGRDSMYDNSENEKRMLPQYGNVAPTFLYCQLQEIMYFGDEWMRVVYYGSACATYLCI